MATATAPAYRVRHASGQRECCRPKRVDEIEGSTHAATGFLLGAGVGLLTNTAVSQRHGIVIGENIARDLMYGFLVAGAALLPDADHPKASFAHAAGFLSHGISHIVAALFGGHRQGMHSLFGIGAMALLAEWLGVWLYPSHLALGILAAWLAICITAGLAVTGFARHGLEALVLGCALSAVAVIYVRADLWWLIALGMALHIAEDEFSGHGCALLWPFTSRRYGGDGKQPAERRSSGRRPKSGYRKARNRAVRGPVSPKPSSHPRTGPTKPACLSCWMHECGECTDRGCGCPERVHPKRRTARAAAPEPERRALPPRPEDDVPPY